MRVDIISPERVHYSGEVELITLPGINGSFTILNNHAPIISILIKGKLSYRTEGTETFIDIEGGFIEMNNNVITVCVG